MNRIPWLPTILMASIPALYGGIWVGTELTILSGAALDWVFPMGITCGVIAYATTAAGLSRLLRR